MINNGEKGLQEARLWACMGRNRSVVKKEEKRSSESRRRFGINSKEEEESLEGAFAW